MSKNRIMEIEIVTRRWNGPFVGIHREDERFPRTYLVTPASFRRALKAAQQLAELEMPENE